VEFNPNPEDDSANQFAGWMRTLPWVPFNESLAAYVNEYTTQKHGPVSVLFIAPFLLLFGKSTTAAVAGSVVIACLVPVVGYFTFRLYFSEILSKIGAASLAVAPGLFIWTRHAAPVPYDVITTLLVACSLYVFLRAIQTDNWWYYVASGVFVSLAGLTKLTGLLIFLPIAIILIRHSDDLVSFGQSVGAVVGSLSVISALFLFAGYNFVAQYLFTAYKVSLGKIHASGGGGGKSQDSPAAALNDDFIGLFGTLYNGRWMHAVLLILAGVLIGYVIWNRRKLADDKIFIGVALLIAFLPFTVWVIFATGTLSRHTIVLLVPFGFSALAGLSTVVEWSGSVSQAQLIRFGQLVILIGAVQLLINM
jgi:4-amino-4-deoxy-L-arabinose transferase-like glycosyltransferase